MNMGPPRHVAHVIVGIDRGDLGSVVVSVRPQACEAGAPRCPKSINVGGIFPLAAPGGAVS